MQVHARAGRHFEKKEFSGAPSRGLKWDNKTYMLKRSILMIVRKKLFLTDACYLACSNGWEVNYYGWQTTDGDRCYNRADNFDICIEGKCRVRH